MAEPIAVGDWVMGTLLRAGVYRVERIVPRFYEEEDAFGGLLRGHAIGEEYAPLVVAKRCFRRTDDDGFARSIGWDHCSAEGCARLPPVFVQRIEAALERDPATRAAFEKFEIPEIKTLYNLGLRLERPEDHAAIESIIPFVREGRTFREIHARLEAVGLERFRPYPHNATLQLENRDHESRDRRWVYRDARIHLLGQGAPTSKKRKAR